MGVRFPTACLYSTVVPSPSYDSATGALASLVLEMLCCPLGRRSVGPGTGLPNISDASRLEFVRIHTHGKRIPLRHDALERLLIPVRLIIGDLGLWRELYVSIRKRCSKGPNKRIQLRQLCQ